MAVTLPHRRPARPATARPDGSGDDGGDGGFVLLESIISITLIGIIMGALTVFSLTVTNSTTYQRQRQSAIRLATSTMEQIRGRTASDLYLGRTPAAATAWAAKAPPAVQAYLTQLVWPDGGSSTLTLPLSTTATIDNTTYTMSTYVGQCWEPASGSTDVDCTNSADNKANGTPYLRAVVGVTWPGSRCPSGTCTIASETLVSGTADPVFALNATPPPAPVIAAPDDRSNIVGDTGDATKLQLALQSGTGVNPTTWVVNGLPTGLGSDSSGLITGITSAIANFKVTVTATDSFLRAATATFDWTVYAPVTVADPGPQTTVVNTAATPVQLSANGGSGAPYTFTVTNLPAGLQSTGTGRISGTPTTTGSSTVTVTATDSSGKHTGKPQNFTWTVTYPPLVAGAIPDQTSQINSAITALQLAASGGSGTYRWTDPNGTLPAGLRVSAAGRVTGTPTRVGSFPVSLLVTDPTAGTTTPQSFTWTVAGTPTATGATALTTTAGATVGTQSIGYTCPTRSCSLTLTGAPSGIGLSTTQSGFTNAVLTVTGSSGTVYLGGMVASSATGGSYPVTVTPLDTATNTAGPATSATWTVNPPPSIASLGGPYTLATGNDYGRLQLGYQCPSGACTFTLAGAPPGMALVDPATGADVSSVQVTSTSGNVFLHALVSATAPATTYALSITPLDTRYGITGSPSRTSVTVTCSSGYAAAIRADNPSLWYRLGETTGTTAADSGSGQKNGIYSGVRIGVTGAVRCDMAVFFDASQLGQVIPANGTIAGPSTFSLEGWFQTTSKQGKIIGFGNSQTGTSGQYDRHVYLNTSGQVVFGVYNGGTRTLTSTNSYADGTWHYFAATFSAGTGMVLYVDGSLVAYNTTFTTAENHPGYWRVGYDNLGGWPGADSTTGAFNGSLDEIAVYPTVLSADQVRAHFNANH